MGKVLVVGGAGYIGSHVVRALEAKGEDILVLDDLSCGHAWAVAEPLLVRGDLGDAALLRRLFTEHEIEAVMHFAGLIVVSESTRDPARYYRNNVSATLTLLDEMMRAGVTRFIFSSTAATYGVPQEVPIPENHPQWPINPYGWSKLMVERMLGDFDEAYGLKSVIFRYFNAAGAHPSGDLGEAHDPETHLIPLVIRAALGQAHLKIFGDDYATPDGTCIRDYIHVTDLADAHILGLERLRRGEGSAAYNLGNGAGYSNREVIRTVEEVSGREVPFTWAPRRPGDPDILIGKADKAKAELGWSPRFPELRDIVATAWRWHTEGQPAREARHG
ncbi:MAG: UDP-glucose 4-epimerase GalE [Candidatus Sericytochromatia bacterium]|nr:UDP-glucose 4-epimerase GalE [Candidatus Sericytochromatia bacterium]